MQIHTKVSNIYCKYAQNAHCTGGKCTLPHHAAFSSCNNPLQPIHWQPPKVDRMLGFVRIGTPRSPLLTPTCEGVTTPLWVPGERAHSLAGVGVGGPNSDEGTDTAVLEVYMYFVVYIYEYNDDFWILFINVRLCL